MALTPDERLAGTIANFAVKLGGKDVVNKVLTETPAAEANDAHRAKDIGEQMKKRT